jgi:hypothetical protein
MIPSDQSSRDWFVRATHSNIENHQGCPWCQRANQLYHSVRGSVREFHCGNCEFYVCHDEITDRYFMGRGTVREAPLTQVAMQALSHS